MEYSNHRLLLFCACYRREICLPKNGYRIRNTTTSRHRFCHWKRSVRHLFIVQYGSFFVSCTWSLSNRVLVGIEQEDVWGPLSSGCWRWFLLKPFPRYSLGWFIRKCQPTRCGKSPSPLMMMWKFETPILTLLWRSRVGSCFSLVEMFHARNRWCNLNVY